MAKRLHCSVSPVDPRDSIHAKLLMICATDLIIGVSSCREIYPRIPGQVAFLGARTPDGHLMPGIGSLQRETGSVRRRPPAEELFRRIRRMR